ncbi:Eco57I restriction-modification methylase domain-containing protein, partial [Chloroflexota bacterium]
VLNTPHEQRHKNILPDADKIPFLNGGLFEPHKKNDFYDGKPQYNLVIPDAWFKQLFEILEQYNFTIDENSTVDADVSVDPEMLGRIFENLLAEVNPVTGETARKATGSYYTPRTIVDYMVDQSLKQYLVTKTKIDEGRINDLLSYEAPEVALSDIEKVSIISALDEIKIIDPACGSGAFPMGILHKMLLVLQKTDPDLKLWLKNHLGNIEPGIFKDRLLERIRNENWEYVRKLLIIQKSIYGVDIQTIAVEISKLRFFLSLIVDEQINDLKENRGVEALPNLEFKFVVANSLIELPPAINRQVGLGVNEEVTKLKELRNRYLRSYGGEKESIQEDFLKTRGNLIEHNVKWGGKDAFALQLASWNPFSYEPSGWFDPEWMFGIGDGFDIVIANPPYIFARNSEMKGLTNKDKKYFYAHYQLAEYQVNLYPLFIEKGTSLLKPNGCLCFITPNNWLTINTNKTMRKFVLAQSDIIIVNFYSRVFESSEVDSSIIIYRSASDNRRLTLCEYTDSLKFVKESECNFFLSQRDHIINIEAFKDTGVASLIDKIDSQSITIEQVADVKAGLVAYEVGKGNPPQTKAMKEKRVYHSTRKINNNFIKYLDGKDVCRYRLDWSGGFLKYGDNLAAPRKDFRLYSTKRILVRQIPSKPPYCINACLVEETVLNDRNSMNIINFKESPECILGILNSRLISFWFVHKFGKMQRNTFPQFKVNELANFPLPKNRQSKQLDIAKLAKQILAAKRADSEADSTQLELQIDQMVYELYGLTPEEIAMVEGTFKK